MNKFKHFLKIVSRLSVNSFGGAQSNLVIMRRKFVDEIHLVSTAEFTELVSFVQLLPGPSSTQLLTLLAFKNWGLRKSILTLLIWIMPACLFMGILSFLIPFIKQYFVSSIVSGLVDFVIASILFNAVFYIKQNVKYKLDYLQLIILSILFVFLFKTPWIFPIVIILCCVISNYTQRNITIETYIPKQKIKKSLIVIFLGLFLVLSFLSEKARIEKWQHRRIFNLTENNYRFGIVFGGGNVLSAMLYEQYAVRPKTKILKKDEALIGMAISQIAPGPIFSYATYVGGLIMHENGFVWQIAGCLLATIGIFIPGFLIAIFCFQFFDSLKKYPIIQKSLHGLNLSICIILIGTFLHLIIDFEYYQWTNTSNIFSCLYIILLTWIMYKNKLPMTSLFFISLLGKLCISYII